MENLKFRATAISALISFVFLCTTILYFYNFLRNTFYSYYAPETLLAFSIGLACSIYEDRSGRRLMASLFVAMNGYLGSGLFRIMFIYLLFIVAAIVCGFGETNFKRSILFLIKFLRAVVVFLVLIVCFSLPLPHGGFAGTGFMEYKSTFLVIVFLPVLSIFVFDSIVVVKSDMKIKRTQKIIKQ